MIRQEVNEISGPLLEPVTLLEVLTQARIDVTTDDEQTVIADIYIPAARRLLETRTGMTFHEKTLEWMLTDFPPFGQPVKLLHATPLIEIQSVIYKDFRGTPFTWDSSLYIADTDSRIGRLLPAYNVPYPYPILFPTWPIRIRGRAGIAAASPATEAAATVKQAMILLVAGMWENREAEIIPPRTIAETVPLRYGVEAMIAEIQREYVF